MSKEDVFIKVTINMPKSHHRKLKAIAALKDIGLSSYIMECIEKTAFSKNGINDQEPSRDVCIKKVEELIEENT